MPKIRFLMKTLDECKQIAKNKEMRYVTDDMYIYGIQIKDFKSISKQAETTGVDIVDVSNICGDYAIACFIKFKEYKYGQNVFIPICFVDRFFNIEELITCFPHCRQQIICELLNYH